MANMVVRRFGILSFAKIQALIMMVFGLIIGVIYGLFFMVIGAAMLSQSTGSAIGGVVGGLVIIVMMPIFYGVIGFVFGALGALIYNTAAGFVGGIEMELETATPDYGTPPPPPQNWTANPYQSNQQM